MGIKERLLYYSMCCYILIISIVPSSSKIFKFSAADIGYALVVGMYLYILASCKESRKRFTLGVKDFFTDKLGISMIILGLIMVCSVTYSLERGLAVTETIRFISYIVLFFIIKYEFYNRSIYNMILNCYIYAAGVLSILGTYQYFFHSDTGKFIANYKFGAKERITATMDNPNQYVAFLIMIIFPLIMMILYKDKKNKKQRIIYIFIALIIMLNIALTFSRNGYVAFFIGCTVLVIIYNWKFISFLIFAAISVLIIPQTSGRILELADKSQNFTRIRLWETAIRMFKEHPILGVGNGNFVSYYDAYIKKYPELYIYYEYKRYPTHNSYLKVLSELGILGIVPFILILSFSIINYIKFIVKRSNDLYKYMCMGFLASTVAFLFMNLSENLFFVPNVTACFWIFLAIEGSITYWEKVR